MVYQNAVESMEDTLLTPAPVEAPGYYNYINPQVDEFFLGQKTAEEALAQAEEDVKKLVEGNQ